MAKMKVRNRVLQASSSIMGAEEEEEEESEEYEGHKRLRWKRRQRLRDEGHLRCSEVGNPAQLLCASSAASSAHWVMQQCHKVFDMKRISSTRS